MTESGKGTMTTRVLVVSVALALVVTGAQAAAPIAGDPEAGRQVFLASGCEACHTAVEDGALPLAGGHVLDTPFGVFHSPNITPDPEHGIGRWSLGDFDRALRRGRAPDGSAYYPAFPYTSYALMTDRDVRDLYAYLMSLEPVAEPSRPHELRWPFNMRVLNRGWQMAFFEPGAWRDRPGYDAEWNRGAYLAQAQAHCGECHTRRGLGGAVDSARPFAGSPVGPGGDPVPNITTDDEAGIGRWSVEDITYYLQTGALPDGDYAGGAMAEVIDNGLTHLPEEDLRAIAVYLKTLRPLQTPQR